MAFLKMQHERLHTHATVPLNMIGIFETGKSSILSFDYLLFKKLYTYVNSDIRAPKLTRNSWFLLMAVSDSFSSSDISLTSWLGCQEVSLSFSLSSCRLN